MTAFFPEPHIHGAADISANLLSGSWKQSRPGRIAAEPICRRGVACRWKSTICSHRQACSCCAAEVGEGDIRLTDAGKRFVQAEVDERKKLFAHHLITYVPLAAHIKRVLDERANHRAAASRFREELEDHMTEEFAEQTFRAIIGWARYAEAFAYDEDTGVFSLENPA